MAFFCTFKATANLNSLWNSSEVHAQGICQSVRWAPASSNAGKPPCCCLLLRLSLHNAPDAFCTALVCLCAPVNSSSISRLVVLVNTISAMCFSSTSDFTFFVSMSETFSSPATFCNSQFRMAFCNHSSCVLMWRVFHDCSLHLRRF